MEKRITALTKFSQRNYDNFYSRGFISDYEKEQGMGINEIILKLNPENYEALIELTREAKNGILKNETGDLQLKLKEFTNQLIIEQINKDKKININYADEANIRELIISLKNIIKEAKSAIENAENASVLIRSEKERKNTTSFKTENMADLSELL